MIGANSRRTVSSAFAAATNPFPPQTGQEQQRGEQHAQRQEDCHARPDRHGQFTAPGGQGQPDHARILQRDQREVGGDAQQQQHLNERNEPHHRAV